MDLSRIRVHENGRVCSSGRENPVKRIVISVFFPVSYYLFFLVFFPCFPETVCFEFTLQQPTKNSDTLTQNRLFINEIVYKMYTGSVEIFLEIPLLPM